jgi:hypothetical protein
MGGCSGVGTCFSAGLRMGSEDWKSSELKQVISRGDAETRGKIGEWGKVSDGVEPVPTRMGGAVGAGNVAGECGAI